MTNKKEIKFPTEKKEGVGGGGKGDANTKSSTNLNFELPLAAGIWFLLSYLNLNH